MTYTHSNYADSLQTPYSLDQYAKKGIVGTLAYGYLRTNDRVLPVTHTDGIAKEVWTLTLPATPIAEAPYFLSVTNQDGQAAELSFVTDADPTTAELQSGIVSINTTHPAMSSIAEITASGANNILVTAEDFRETLSVYSRAIFSVAIPASPDDSTTYELVINGITVSYAADADSTQEEVQDGLYQAILANSSAAAAVVVSKISTTGLLIYSAVPAAALTLTTNDGVTTADIVITDGSISISKTTAQSLGKVIPFGVIVASNTDYQTEASPRGTSREKLTAKLPSTTGDRLIGAVPRKRYLELGDTKDIQEGFRAKDPMDIMHKFEAMWIACVEADLAPSDTIYVDASTDGQRGYLTRESSNNIAASNFGIKVLTEAVWDGDNQVYMVQVEGQGFQAY